MRKSIINNLKSQKTTKKRYCKSLVKISVVNTANNSMEVRSMQRSGTEET